MSDPGTTTDLQLLARYAADHAETAFTELVRRHVNLVHSAALRQVHSPQLAEEVAQSVFTDLARNAAKLKPDTILTAWLYQVPRRTAIDVVRREARRQLREQIATELNAMNTTTADWTHIEPQLDEAVSALEESDRTAILLRYFENKSLREVGAILGTSDDAAQKRVTRAVERLREFFTKRGVTVGASGLVLAISANAVQAAPVGLAMTISAAATLAGTTLAATIATQTTVTTMNWLNLKSITAVIAAAIAAGTGTYLVQQHTADQLRAENQKLVAAEQILTTERDTALAAANSNTDELKRRQSEKDELLRLRGEVGRLRKLAKDAEQLAEQNRALQNALAQASQTASRPEPEADPERRFAIERLNQSKHLVLGLIMYAGDNQDMLPTDLNSISNYLGNAASEHLSNNSFELVLQGAITNIANPSTTIAVRSKSPFAMNGKSAKVYGFADGHAELKREPEEGFEAWEKARTIPAPTGQ